MIRIKPLLPVDFLCECGGSFNISGIVWQGLHVCRKLICRNCNRLIFNSIPVNQSGLNQYNFYPEQALIKDQEGNIVPDNWYSRKLKSIAKPVDDMIEMDIEVFKRTNKILILNTLDIVYGHSLLFLLNLQKILRSETTPDVIVIVQPMMKWLVPRENIAEIWTVNLGFNKFNNFYTDLSEKINRELERFTEVYLSKGHIVPTNSNIEIEKFSGIRPFDFSSKPQRPRITFIWREDADRLWIRSFYLLKGFKKLGISKLLLPFHFFRVIRFLQLVRKKMGPGYRYTVAGLGKSFSLPQSIEDHRILSFNEENERNLCRVYAESELVIGVHGSGLTLPSAHAGMVVSLMPSRRWGNYAEDILFTETDVRLAAFQRRIVPLNLCMLDIRDIVCDMISGRDYYVRKFIHDEEL